MRPTEGVKLYEAPTGFPLYFKKLQPRVVTADVWAFLKTTVQTSKNLTKDRKRQAEAFIDQAFEFFEAAQTPRTASRPLLYYYSFLNLAKATLLISGTELPPVVRHGIHDPDENLRKIVRLAGQKVRAVKCAHNHSQLYPEFVQLLGGDITKPSLFKIVDLLRQIPGVHRTFCRVTTEEPSCLPIKRFEFFKVPGKKVFVRMILDQKDKDVKVTLDNVRNNPIFKKLFKKVSVPIDRSGLSPEEIWFDSTVVAGSKLSVNSALRALAIEMKTLGFSAILTSVGYRHYLVPTQTQCLLPPLAVIYAVMFYFGSITRYKPYDFDKIVSNKFDWLVQEFLKTQPNQFLHGIASHMAGVDVVLPYAYIQPS